MHSQTIYLSHCAIVCPAGHAIPLQLNQLVLMQCPPQKNLLPPSLKSNSTHRLWRSSWELKIRWSTSWKNQGWLSHPSCVLAPPPPPLLLAPKQNVPPQQPHNPVIPTPTSQLPHRSSDQPPANNSDWPASEIASISSDPESSDLFPNALPPLRSSLSHSQPPQVHMQSWATLKQ